MSYTKWFFVFLLCFSLNMDLAISGPKYMAVPVKAVIFEDDFDSGLLKWNRWEGVSPAWSVVSSDNLALLQADTRAITRQLIYAPGSYWSDYNLTCMVRVHCWGGQNKNFAWDAGQFRRVYWSVAVRVKNAGNCYRLEYIPWAPEKGSNKQPYYRLVKYTNGIRTELASVISDFHSDLDHCVRFEALGTRLRARVWPAEKPEPEEWTISAKDKDHVTGTVSLITANVAMLFDEVCVKGKDSNTLLDEKFERKILPETWLPLSGSWSVAPWGKELVRTAEEGSKVLSPVEDVPLPAAIIQKIKLQSNGKLNLEIRDSELIYRLELDSEGLSIYRDNEIIKKEKLSIETNRVYTFTVKLDSVKWVAMLEKYPLTNGNSYQAVFDLPDKINRVHLGYLPDSYGVSVDDLVIEANVPVKKALEEYLRYICDWYMSLELPSGYPKTGTGSTELFIASYCARTLMAAAQILDDPSFLEEALRWADFVTTSESVLVPLITGTGKEALGLRTYRDWSVCVNLADIGSVLSGVGILYPWAETKRQARYLEVMEKYSLYVTEGCLEDPLVLGRGNQPQGWRITDGPDRGGFANGYWWMEKRDWVWDISTSNVGMQFYSVLYGLTGKDEYSKYVYEAVEWFIHKNIDTDEIFESFHDVIYGGEGLIMAYENVGDNFLKQKIDKAVGKLCTWAADQQNPDGTWNQVKTPKNNRTNRIWLLLNWYGIKHPEDEAVREALNKTLTFHLDRENSRKTGVCEILRKTCFTGASVADILMPGVTVELPDARK